MKSEPVSTAGNTPPTKIYLQWHGADRDELTPEELLEPAPIETMTWCQHKINDTDVEYARVAASSHPKTEAGNTPEPKIESCPDCGAVYSMMEPGGITNWGCSNVFHSRGRVAASSHPETGDGNTPEQLTPIERAARRLAANHTICSQIYSEKWRVEHIEQVLESEFGVVAASSKEAMPCQHDRLDEDGYCRKCGADMRSGINLAEATPSPASKKLPIGEDFTGYSVHSDESGWLLSLSDFMADWMRRYPAKSDASPATKDSPNVEWICEDELPEGYPYDEMFPHSKLGQDGLGGVRIFPKIAAPSPAREDGVYHKFIARVREEEKTQASQGPVREETPATIEKLALKYFPPMLVPAATNHYYVGMAESVNIGQDLNQKQRQLCSYALCEFAELADAGARSVVVAPIGFQQTCSECDGDGCGKCDPLGTALKIAQRKIWLAADETCGAEEVSLAVIADLLVGVPALPSTPDTIFDTCIKTLHEYCDALGAEGRFGESDVHQAIDDVRKRWTELRQHTPSVPSSEETKES